MSRMTYKQNSHEPAEHNRAGDAFRLECERCGSTADGVGECKSWDSQDVYVLCYDCDEKARSLDDEEMEFSSNARETVLFARQDNLKDLPLLPSTFSWKPVRPRNVCNLCSAVQHPCLNQVGYEPDVCHASKEKMVYYMCDQCWTVMFDPDIRNPHYSPFDLSDEEATQRRSTWRKIADRVKEQNVNLPTYTYERIS